MTTFYSENEQLSPESLYDIIGDIHGHYNELIMLFKKLGYEEFQTEAGLVYINPSGYIPIFVGDLVDRGANIKETVDLVMRMEKLNLCYCVKGNHEYNMINFWELMPNNKTGYYRTHNPTNILQHCQTVRAYLNRDKERLEAIEWMRSLPVMLDLPKLRVVHAAYHKHLDEVQANYVDDVLIIEKTNDASDEQLSELDKKAKNSLLFEATRLDKYVYLGKNPVLNGIGKSVENVLKGVEFKLPDGFHYFDKEGTKRTRSRVKWWLNPSDCTYGDYLEPPASLLPEEFKKSKVDINLVDKDYLTGYGKDEKPIFFGHYWLKIDGDSPKIQSENVCCLDYSVAKKGHLVAYRFSGEDELSNSQFVFVKTLSD